MTTILYAPASTMGQTIADQAAQARAAGFAIDNVVWDEDVDRIRLRLSERPQGRRLFDLLRAGDTLIVRWVDRLGRNSAEAADAIREFMRRGVIVRTIVGGLTFDGATTDPTRHAVQDALMAYMAATAQAQTETAKEAQRAGIERAKANARDNKYRGRKPSYSRAQFDAVREMLSQGTSIGSVAAATGLSRQTVYRIRDDAPGAEAALAQWGM
ncbi:MAG: recombinase family protein [Methylocystis sp.]|uniref:recombinase family protein n=1 Tax=Methylocystis sp. TaxID=1911079 RepID=UPI003D143372